MGISADLDPKLQEELSREFRKEVRKLANIDFAKTWTQLSREGKTEGMISSKSTLPFPFAMALMIGRL